MAHCGFFLTYTSSVDDEREETFAVTCNDCWIDAPVNVDISPGLVLLADTEATITFGESQGRFDVKFSAD